MTTGPLTTSYCPHCQQRDDRIADLRTENTLQKGTIARLKQEVSDLEHKLRNKEQIINNLKWLAEEGE